MKRKELEEAKKLAEEKSKKNEIEKYFITKKIFEGFLRDSKKAISTNEIENLENNFWNSFNLNLNDLEKELKLENFLKINTMSLLENYLKKFKQIVIKKITNNSQEDFEIKFNQLIDKDFLKKLQNLEKNNELNLDLFLKEILTKFQNLRNEDSLARLICVYDQNLKHINCLREKLSEIEVAKKSKVFDNLSKIEVTKELNVFDNLSEDQINYLLKTFQTILLPQIKKETIKEIKIFPKLLEESNIFNLNNGKNENVKDNLYNNLERKKSFEIFQNIRLLKDSLTYTEDIKNMNLLKNSIKDQIKKNCQTLDKNSIISFDQNYKIYYIFQISNELNFNEDEELKEIFTLIQNIILNPIKNLLEKIKSLKILSEKKTVKLLVNSELMLLFKKDLKFYNNLKTTLDIKKNPNRTINIVEFFNIFENKVQTKIESINTLNQYLNFIEKLEILAEKLEKEKNKSEELEKEKN